jgi:hypothetical protein
LIFIDIALAITPLADIFILRHISFAARHIALAQPLFIAILQRYFMPVDADAVFAAMPRTPVSFTILQLFSPRLTLLISYSRVSPCRYAAATPYIFAFYFIFFRRLFSYWIIITPCHYAAIDAMPPDID